MAKISLFNLKKWSKLFSDNSFDLIGDAVESGWNNGNSLINGGINFDITNPDVIEFIKNKTIKFSNEVNKTTAEKLNEIIKSILIEGGSVEQVRKKIQKEITKIYLFSKLHRARMIARTEIIGSNNGGALLSYKKSGVVNEKEWLTSRDKLVRHSHQRANRQIRKLNKPFLVGRSKLMHPGDSNLGADVAEIVNCRCIVIPIRRGKNINSKIDYKLWKALIAASENQEKLFAKVITKLFRKQEIEVLKNAKKIKI